MSRRRALPPLLPRAWAPAVPLALAAFLLGPLPAPLAAQDVESQNADPPVPQEFDWWEARGVEDVTPWGQAVDTEATRLLLSWTTSEEFTNPHVDHLPYDPEVVSPMDHFGYPMGRPGHLHRTDELYGYYEALAASSDRVHFELRGETEEGNRFALVKVGSEENLARLDEIRGAYQALTDPRRTTREEAERLIQDLPVIHTVFSGLHSPETGHPEVTPELAYRVAVSDDPLVREIRDNAILFIVPVTEPDGRNRVVDWYRKHGEGIYDFDDRIPGPPFWGKYIRHDNNRDGLQMTLRLSEYVLELFQEWRYPIAIDLHESVPFLYVSTGTGPYNPNIDAVTRHEWQWVAHHEVTSLTALGMPGVWTHDFFDGWNPGYMVFVLNNRNAIGRFYETFGSSIPTTMERTVGGNRTSVEWFRANPPYAEVIWSLRNNINYAQTGVLHSLNLVAENRERVLRNYRTKAENSLNRGLDEAPHAWVVPADQARKGNAQHMVNLLQRHGIEVHRAEADGTFEGMLGDPSRAARAEPEEADGAADRAEESEEEAGDPDEAGGEEVPVRSGDLIVRMDQPYRDFIKNLMEMQHFPEDAPRPYDDVAWTFPLIYNVVTHQVDDPAVLELAMTEVTEEARLPGSLRTAGAAVEWWVARYEATHHALPARHRLGEIEVYAAREAFDLPGGESAGAGSWLIRAGEIERDELEAWAGEFGLEVVGVPGDVVADVDRHRQDFPRIALLHSWRNTQDDGSIRHFLDLWEVPYTYLPEDRLAGADLRGDFDVILFPDQGRNAEARQIFHGIDPDEGPLPYVGSDDFPSLGYPSSSEDITGGMGYDGLSALNRFVEGGGTLVALGSAATFPVEFGMVRGVSLRSPPGLFSPGSIVKGRVENGGHPLTWGYQEEMPLFDRFGPYLQVSGSRSENVVVRYADADELFMSGLVLGPGGLGGQPALVSVPVGEGHIVLFGFRSLHRNQTRGSFAFAWNAVLNWNQLDVGLDAVPAVTEEDGELGGTEVEAEGAGAGG